MMLPKQEWDTRLFVRKMSNALAGQPLDKGVVPIKPSQVQGIEKKLNATGLRQPFAGQHGERSSFLRGASTIENYAKAARTFDIQNNLLECFCRLLSQKTGESCGIILAPSKTEQSSLKKYWTGGKEASGWQGEFKDLTRCTIVCYQEAMYPLLPAKISAELMNPCYNKMWKAVARQKGKEGEIGKVRVRDDSPDDMGYIDTNITLILPNSAMVEVQINIQSTLYGKMGRPAFIDEACPPELGESQYASIEKKKRIPGGCGHVIYEVYKDIKAGRQCNKSMEEVRQLSRDYYDHLSDPTKKLDPDDIVRRLTELSNTDLWKHTYHNTKTHNPRGLPAFAPGTKWKVGDRA